MKDTYRGKEVWRDAAWFRTRKECREQKTKPSRKFSLEWLWRCLKLDGLEDNLPVQERKHFKTSGYKLQKRKRKGKDPATPTQRGRPKGSGMWLYDENRNVIGRNPKFGKFDYNRRKRQVEKFGDDLRKGF